MSALRFQGFAYLANQSPFGRSSHFSAAGSQKEPAPEPQYFARLGLDQE